MEEAYAQQEEADKAGRKKDRTITIRVMKMVLNESFKDGIGVD